MRIVVLVAVLGASAPLAAAGQTRQAAPRQQATPPAPAPDRTAEAYAQFLQAHMLADEDKTDEAIAAYRRAMTLDPASATIPAELAELFFGENRATDAQGAAEQALKIDAGNKQAHRVLGQVHAGLAGTAPDTRAGRAQQQENITSAVEHLEKSLESPVKLTDIDIRALLSRLYVAAEQFDKAIPLLARHRQGGARLARRPDAADGGVHRRGQDARGGHLARGVGARQPAALFVAGQLLRTRAALGGRRRCLRAGR